MKCGSRLQQDAALRKSGLETLAVADPVITRIAWLATRPYDLRFSCGIEN